MRSYLILLGLTLMLLLPSLTFAARLPGPVHNFSCDQCHKAGATINELGGDNVCLGCHGASPSPMTMNLDDTSYTSVTGFIIGDASDQYLHNAASADETSHHWSASSTNPDAGAAEPNRALYPGLFGNYNITC